MKKELLFKFTKSLARKMSFRMAAFAVLTLLTAQSSFAQTTYTWLGGTSSELTTFANWSPIPSSAFVTGTTGDNLSVSVTGNNSDQVTNTAAINCRQITLNSGVTFDVNANITTHSSATTSANGIININAGTSTIVKFYIGNAAAVSGVVNVATGAILTGNNVWRIGANATGIGTLNINGGTLTLGPLGSLSLGNASTGIININSGTVNVNYTLFTSLSITANGLINIDGGSMVIPGNQTTAVQAFIDGGRIKTSGAALTAGKTISNTYDAGTDKTTVLAITTPLGVNDVALDANRIVVYSQNQSIKIQSGKVISDVKVYDLLGHLVASKKSIGLNETSIALNALNAVYVVTVTTTDGRVVTKKIIQ